MDDTETARFRALIASRLADLDAQNARGRESQAVVELDQQSVGRLSRMDALQAQAMARAQQERRNLEARRLRAALARMDEDEDEDEFGWCEDCGESIAPARLELDPAAMLCVRCASA